MEIEITSKQFEKQDTQGFNFKLNAVLMASVKEAG